MTLFIALLLSLILIVPIAAMQFYWFYKTYGTRAERKELEKQLLKDMELLRSQPFTNGKSPSETNKATEIPFDHPSQS